MKKFVAAFDLHFGYERRNGHKTPLHDEKALNCMLEFTKDFKPDYFIWGGDALDCGVISHHNHGKPGATEGFRLIGDATEGRKAFIEPIEKIIGNGELVYITGNHEDWLADLTDKIPALEGLVDLKSLLKLDKWAVIPQGEAYRLGKLVFIHGDQVKGGEHSAKWATLAYEKNVRFGHHHTAQLYSKTSAIEANGHTGIAVPCLCKKGPRYGGGSPNKWQQGFLWGYTGGPKGLFNDYLTIIIDGKAIINGKLYEG